MGRKRNKDIPELSAAESAKLIKFFDDGILAMKTVYEEYREELEKEKEEQRHRDHTLLRFELLEYI